MLSSHLYSIALRIIGLNFLLHLSAPFFYWGYWEREGFMEYFLNPLRTGTFILAPVIMAGLIWLNVGHTFDDFRKKIVYGLSILYGIYFFVLSIWLYELPSFQS